MRRGSTVAAVVAAVASCGPPGAPVRPIERSRIVEVADASWSQPTSTAERFGWRTEPRGASPAARLRWSVPPEWTEVAPSAMRAGSFRIPGGGDCSITAFPGDGGGLAANVNRWRGQLQCPPLDAAGLGELERVPMLGGTGRLVDVLAPCGAADGNGLLAVVALLDRRAVFVKLTGPIELLRAQREAFLALCASLEELP